MKELRQTFAIAVILLLAGCGPGVRVTKIDSPTAAQLNSTMRVIEGPAPQRAQLIGPVDATSCMNKAWDPSPTNANAILINEERGHGNLKQRHSSNQGQRCAEHEIKAISSSLLYE